MYFILNYTKEIEKKKIKKLIGTGIALSLLITPIAGVYTDTENQLVNSPGWQQTLSKIYTSVKDQASESIKETYLSVKDKAVESIKNIFSS